MRTRLALPLLAAAVHVAAADVDPPSKWVDVDQKSLGLHVRHPASAHVAVHGSEVTISGAEIPTVSIAVKTTTDRSTAKSGGVHDRKVEWTVSVPKRTATCTSTATNEDQATLASRICDTIVLVPGARDPHVELVVSSTGLADGPGYERGVRAKAREIDACWKSALAKDTDLPEGAVELHRTYDHGQPATTNESRQNFFDHDAKPLGACIVALVKAVPVKTSADTAEIKITAICHLY
jgi:hypothetical protein